MTTKITPSVLENTAVTPTTYGTGAAIPTITVDAQGRITAASNTNVGIATSQITSGTLADARLPDTGATAGSYGSASIVPRIIVDAKGRSTGVANITIAIASSAVSGLATSATTDTTSATNISSGTLAAARLADSGVSATTYGTASSVSQVTVDAKGRITGASNVAIQIATSQITGYPSFAASATTDTTNAGNISTGTLPDARLSNAGVNNGSFGSASVVPAITVDTKGRVTAVTATSIAIAAGAVSGLATVATSGSYTDLSNRPSVPAAQVNSDWNATTGVAAISNKPSLATVATTGSYNDLSNKPTIPTTVGQLTAVAPDVQQFNSTGTWTKPTGGQTMAFIQIWGGGGAGSGASYSQGGGGGGYSAITIPLSYMSTQTVVVGAGGSPGAFNAASGTGGNSSVTFSSFNGKTQLLAYGGTGGGVNPYGGLGLTNGGLGGVANFEGGGFTYSGGNAGFAGAGGGSSFWPYGNYGGGFSIFGGAGGTGWWDRGGDAGAAPGGGGGGSSQSFGGAGGSGRIIITSY